MNTILLIIVMTVAVVALTALMMTARSKKTEIGSREDIISGLKKEIASREDIIRCQEKEASLREEVVHGLEKEIGSRDVIIRGMEKDVQYRDEQIETLRREKLTAVEELKAEHDKAVTSLRKNYEQSMAEARQAGEKNISSLRQDYEKNLTETRQAGEKNISVLRQDYEKNLTETRLAGERALSALRQNYEQSMAEAKEANEKSLRQQIAAVKAQIASESEKMLKERQEEFDRNAKKAFSDIAGDFNKNLKDMKDAFETNKKTQHDTSAELRIQIGEAVKNLKEQTLNVGEKAEHLASALRGQSKMQGCWGETQLNNILIAEGLTEGRDYDREETLRDEMGIVLHNEDTGKRMRPDFILHYPDSTDVVIDCKVSLNALADFFSAETPADRDDAAERNLKAVRDHVEELARKDYSSYIRPPRRCIDYTVMYVPNVNALVLARQKDPHIITDAFRKNVLITSEETLMPFLRMVRTAWVNYDQARNQEKIVAEARKMIDRVQLFCDDYARLGQKLKDAARAYEDGGVKLREGGQSILRAAHEVERLGVKGKKGLAPIDEDLSQ